VALGSVRGHGVFARVGANVLRSLELVLVHHGAAATAARAVAGQNVLDFLEIKSLKSTSLFSDNVATA
jgi:hypothetical protein